MSVPEPTKAAQQRLSKMSGVVGLRVAEAWRRGCPCDIKHLNVASSGQYFSSGNGESVILIKKHKTIESVISGREVIVRFRERRPDLVCRSCGSERPSAANTGACTACGGASWRLVR